MTSKFFTVILFSLMVFTAANAAYHEVMIQNFAFNPLELTIQVGDTVRWTNMDSYPHTATANGGEFDSGNLNLDDSYEYKFTTAGTYPYYCAYHANMTAVITVEGGAQHSEFYHVVNIQNFAFDPQNLTIAVGDTVQWINMDSAPHTATEGNGEFDSGTLNNGDSYEHIFMTAGEFSYICSIHTNMNGTITVEGGAQHSEFYHVVNIQNFAFDPQNLTIAVGDTVQWINMDSAPHTATEGNGEFNSGTLNNGDSYEHIFMTAGEFSYICSIHTNMNGTITVEGGAQHSEFYHVVNIQNFAFDPQNLTIAVGDTVQWINIDSAPHTATEGNGEFDSGTLNNGDSYEHIFMTPGEFSYICSIHTNMNGTITVAGEQHSEFFHVVNIQNFAFDPQMLEIEIGDTVRWINMDSSPHTATATGGEFNSGNLNQGDSYDYIFNTEGHYAYVCYYHSNMTGMITVGDPVNTNSAWELLNSSSTLPLNDIRFWNATTGWAAGEGGVMRTTDGGETWTNYQTSDDVEALSFVSESEGWICGNDGMIMHTTDGGVSWESQTSGVSEKLRDIWFSDDMSGWAVGRDGILLHTSDGGDNWSSQSSPATDDLRGIHMLDDMEGWIVGSDGLILYTANGGQTWQTQLSVPDGEEDEFESVFALNADYAWAVGGQGRVYATTDGGDNWNMQQSGTTVALMDVFFTDMESGWIGGAGGFLSNAMMGGAMWHTQIAPSSATFNSVYFVNSGLGFMTGSNGMIFKYEVIQSASDTPELISASSIELQPAYPNPFNPSTTLSLVNPQTQWVKLTIFDLLGREVATLQNAPLTAGQHSFTFDAAGLATGLYIAQVKTANAAVTRKLTLVK